jgi:hypothetical protein
VATGVGGAMAFVDSGTLVALGTDGAVASRATGVGPGLRDPPIAGSVNGDDRGSPSPQPTANAASRPTVAETQSHRMTILALPGPLFVWLSQAGVTSPFHRLRR